MKKTTTFYGVSTPKVSYKAPCVTQPIPIQEDPLYDTTFPEA
jgi:hypothetical protein